MNYDEDSQKKEDCFIEKTNKTAIYKNKDGKLHRENGPAVESINGDKYWYINDQLHRIDGPAIEWANGSKAWFINGQLHRTDGPAIEKINGKKEWYLNGQQVVEKSRT